MDHMRMSGTEPSSVIIRQRKKFEMLKRDDQKCQKQDEAKSDGVINPTKLQFQSILNTKNLDALKNATNQPKSTAEFGYMCPRRLYGPPALTLTK